MDDEAKALLRRIAESGERTAEGIEKIAGELSKPPKLGDKLVTALGAGAAAVSMMNAVDLIIKWVGG